jgi:hypothetical protein
LLDWLPELELQDADVRKPFHASEGLAYTANEGGEGRLFCGSGDADADIGYERGILSWHTPKPISDRLEIDAEPSDICVHEQQTPTSCRWRRPPIVVPP